MQLRLAVGGTDLGVLMVQEAGVPWRTAHQIGGILFRLCDERGIRPAEITVALLDEAAEEYFDRRLGLSTAAIQGAMDPAVIVRSRTHLGGSSPDQIRQSADWLTRELAADVAWLAGRRARVSKAAAELEAAMGAMEQGADTSSGDRAVAGAAA